VKIVNVPYTTSTGKVIDFALFLLGFFSFAGLMISLPRLEWMLSLGFFVVFALLCVFAWKRISLQLFIWPKDYLLATSKAISEINLDGFNVSHKKSRERLLWRDIVNMWLDKNENLLVQLNDTPTLVLNQNYEGWYILLKNIPALKMRDASITDYLDELYSNVSSCKICGYVSVKDGECLCCYEILSDEGNYESENAYIREKQLVLFSPLGTNEVSFILDDEDNGFRFDDKWKPLVSKDEVLAFSKERND
jgi:hypothetical protein